MAGQDIELPFCHFRRWHRWRRTNLRIHLPHIHTFTLCTQCASAVHVNVFCFHNCVRRNSNASKSRDNETGPNGNEDICSTTKSALTYAAQKHTTHVHRTMASSWTCGYRVNKEQLMVKNLTAGRPSHRIVLDSEFVEPSFRIYDCVCVVCAGLRTGAALCSWHELNKRHKDRPNEK